MGVRWTLAVRRRRSARWVASAAGRLREARPALASLVRARGASVWSCRPRRAGREGLKARRACSPFESRQARPREFVAPCRTGSRNAWPGRWAERARSHALGDEIRLGAAAGPPPRRHPRLAPRLAPRRGSDAGRTQARAQQRGRCLRSAAEDSGAFACSRGHLRSRTFAGCDRCRHAFFRGGSEHLRAARRSGSQPSPRGGETPRPSVAPFRLSGGRGHRPELRARR